MSIEAAETYKRDLPEAELLKSNGGHWLLESHPEDVNNAVRRFLFVELGFSAEEAKRLHAASRRQINDARLLKAKLMEELSVWIKKHHLKQSEVAEILMVSRPRVSDVVNKKTAKFTIDTLVEMLSRVGKPVRLAVS